MSEGVKGSSCRLARDDSDEIARRPLEGCQGGFGCYLDSSLMTLGCVVAYRPHVAHMSDSDRLPRAAAYTE